MMGIFRVVAQSLGLKKSAKVSKAQIQTMLHRTNNALTATRLAKAAGCTVEEASEALKKMAVDGELEYDVGPDELIYRWP